MEGSTIVSGAGRFFDDDTDTFFSGALSGALPFFCFFFGGTRAEVEATGRLAKISSISDMVPSKSVTEKITAFYSHRPKFQNSVVVLKISTQKAQRPKD